MGICLNFDRYSAALSQGLYVWVNIELGRQLCCEPRAWLALSDGRAKRLLTTTSEECSMRDYNSNCSVAKTSLYIYIALCLVGMAGVVHANHCKHGFVWRAASPSDLVCVTPQQRDQAAWDNEDAASRIAPCRSGFVFRNAAPGDKVCVTPAARDLASMDKRTVDARTECVLRKTFRCRFVPGHIDEHGNIVEHPKFHKNCQCLNIPPSTCSPGYVHRLATPTDLKCVLPEAHSRIAQENADAPKNKGVHDCISGYVWRNAFPGDLVCVTPGSTHKFRLTTVPQIAAWSATRLARLMQAPLSPKQKNILVAAAVGQTTATATAGRPIIRIISIFAWIRMDVTHRGRPKRAKVRSANAEQLIPSAALGTAQTKARAMCRRPSAMRNV